MRLLQGNKILSGIFFILFSLSLISLVSADLGYSSKQLPKLDRGLETCPNGWVYEIDFDSDQITCSNLINTSTVSVNISEYANIWITNEGNMDNVVDLYPTLTGQFLNLSGTNANQNLNVSPYNISADYFFGDGSQLTGLSWTRTGTVLTTTTAGDTVKLNSDNQKLFFGGGDDASVTFDGTFLEINSQEVGTNKVRINSSSLKLIQTLEFETSGLNNIFVPNDGYLRFGGSSTHKPQVLVVGDSYHTDPGRVVFRYGDGGSIWEYTDGSSRTGTLKVTDTDIHVVQDSFKFFVGTGKDASLYYDGTNLFIDPKEVGSGELRVLGDLNVTGGVNITDNLQVGTGTGNIIRVGNQINSGTTGTLSLHGKSAGGTPVSLDIKMNSNGFTSFDGSTSSNILSLGTLTGNIGIGEAVPLSRLHIYGTSLSSSTVIQERDEATTFGPYHYYLKSRSGGTPNANDYSGGPNFAIMDEGNANHIYASIWGQVTNVGSGTEEGSIYFSAGTGGNIGTPASNSIMAIVGSDGSMKMTKDNGKFFLGAGSDASLYYDGTNMFINPKEVGTGELRVLGGVNVTGNLTINPSSGTLTSPLIIDQGTVDYTSNDDSYGLWLDKDTVRPTYPATGGDTYGLYFDLNINDAVAAPSDIKYTKAVYGQVLDYTDTTGASTRARPIFINALEFDGSWLGTDSSTGNSGHELKGVEGEVAMSGTVNKASGVYTGRSYGGYFLSRTNALTRTSADAYIVTTIGSYGIGRGGGLGNTENVYGMQGVAFDGSTVSMGGDFRASQTYGNYNILSARGVLAQVFNANSRTGTISNAQTFFGEAMDAEDGTITTGTGLYLSSPEVDGGTFGTYTHIWLEDATVAGTNRGIVIDSDTLGVHFGASQDAGILFDGSTLNLNDSDVRLPSDNQKLFFGGASDASLYYDGTNMFINPKEVGSGELRILGDLNVTNNFTGNQIYIEVYGRESGSLPVAEDVYYNITNMTEGQSNGFTFDGNDTITALVDGLYKVSSQYAFSGTANNEYHLRLAVSGTAQNNCHTERVIGTGGDVGSASITCFVRLVVNNYVNVQVENVDSGGDPLIHDVNLNLMRIGD